MIVYSNIQQIAGLEFEKYLGMPGYSFSFLKQERNGIPREVPMTEKILIGKMVDAILTEDGEVNMLSPLYPIARSIAEMIRKSFGTYIQRFEKQLSYMADLTFEGHMIRVRGRMDYVLPKHAVIDLKVTHEKDIRALIKYMQYDDQLWNYSNLAQVKRKYIMIHSVPLKTTQIIDMGVVTPRNEFWEAKILKFGEPIAA